MLSQNTLFGIDNELVPLSVLVLFVVFSLAETVWPRHPTAKKIRGHSYRTNLGLLAFNSIVMSLLSVSGLYLLAQQNTQQGLLRYLENPYWQAVLSFLLLDLLLYLWHRLCHATNLFWMFHRVHHNDPALNASTGFRVHPLELLLTNLLKAAYIVVMGVDQLMVLVNETLMAGAVLFHHSNVTINTQTEKWLGRVFIVPALHRIHHSALRGEHDSNYGTVLSIWDRLFGSLTVRQPAALGLQGDTPLTVFGLLLFGFTPIRQATANDRAALPNNLSQMIAEAAYYKAEKRNFMPGHDVLDWIEAQEEIIGRFSGTRGYHAGQRQAS